MNEIKEKLKCFLKENKINEKTFNNSCWIIDNLEDGNLPETVSLYHSCNKDVILESKISKDYSDDIRVDDDSILYTQYYKYKIIFLKRYLFTPNKDIGKKELFFLNKEMEFFRREYK